LSFQFSVVSFQQDYFQQLKTDDRQLKAKDMKSSNFRDLMVWQKAMDLTVEIYLLVKHLPKEENYALSDQMRRAAVSVPSNIAEGHGRDSAKEFVRFLSMARGSLRELSTKLEICIRLQYLNESNTLTSNTLITEVDKMLTSLATKLTTEN
jgi:four helix bundle protein